MTNVAYNCDCMEYMRTLPDKAFDLAVVDPPYGSGDSQFVHVERERKTDPRQKILAAVRRSFRQIQTEFSGRGAVGR